MKTDTSKSKSAKPAPAKSAKPVAKKAAPAPAAEITEAKQPSEQSEMLREFFVDGLKDIYWAEKHLIKVLPKMRKASTTQTLSQAIDQHIAVTGTQAQGWNRLLKC